MYPWENPWVRDTRVGLLGSTSRISKKVSWDYPCSSLSTGGLDSGESSFLCHFAHWWTRMWPRLWHSHSHHYPQPPPPCTLLRQASASEFRSAREWCSHSLTVQVHFSLTCCTKEPTSSRFHQTTALVLTCGWMAHGWPMVMVIHSPTV